MKELFMSQEVRLNGMTQANEIRPNNPAMPLTQALEGIEDVDWTLCPDPELPVNGVSVSSTDMEEGWIFIAIPGLVQHGIRFLHSALSSGACAVVTDPEGASRACAEYPSLPIVVVPSSLRMSIATRPRHSKLLRLLEQMAKRRRPIFCGPFFEEALAIQRCVEQSRSGLEIS